MNKLQNPARKVAIALEAYTPLNFSEVENTALSFATYIKKHSEKITEILLQYESFEVARDETARTLDLLTNLKENKQYFKLRIGSVATFLPRNQPLYALTCFAVIPSLMASSVYLRIPKSMRNFLPSLLDRLKLNAFFPNIFVTEESHQDFLRKHSAIRVHPVTQSTIPVTDAVIFTGTPERADQLRSVFDSRTIFISNGAGHNPVIVSSDADLEKACEAVLCLQLYNQGQDCAAPNSILVNKKIFVKFYKLLFNRLHTFKIGAYNDRTCSIGPISDASDLVRIEDFLIKNRQFIDRKTPGIIRSLDAIVEPTIICKPLKDGGNFVETFAPIIIVQEYDSDSDLALYFENTAYHKNAMYVTLYGSSEYVKTLNGKKVNGKLLHDDSTILINTHLHAPGVERGTKPYGGYGYGASNLWVRGSGISKPTLPQRDIYEHVALPILKKKSLTQYRKNTRTYTELKEKNIERLLRIGGKIDSNNSTHANTKYYLDFNMLAQDNNKARYKPINLESAYKMLSKPNVNYLKDLTPRDINNLRKLCVLLRKKPKSNEEFSTQLYSISADNTNDLVRRGQQKQFFEHIYQLLFGGNSGPKLTIFLWEIEFSEVANLLDI